MVDYPILSILVWLPIIVGLFLVISNDISKMLSSIVTLLTTLVVMLISISFFRTMIIYQETFNLLRNIYGFLVLRFLFSCSRWNFCIINLAYKLYKSFDCYIRFIENYVNKSSYLGYFLVLEGLLIGTFTAFDSILFYIFFESLLIPLFLIIGIWVEKIENTQL